MFHSQPLALGAIGLAIGAAVAASLPATETESEYLGDTSALVRKSVANVAGQAIEEATDGGKNAAAAMMDEAQQQGLTKDGRKSARSNCQTA